MKLKEFTPAANENSKLRAEAEQNLSAFVNSFNPKPHVDHTKLDSMINECEKYITSIPFEDGRKYFYHTALELKTEFRSKYPNAEVILELQRELVNLRSLPEAPSLAKARWLFLKKLLNPTKTDNTIVAGRRLRPHQWREFRYSGNFESYRWINNIPDYHLISYQEAYNQRTVVGIGMQNIYYADETERENFLTSTDKQGRLIDSKGNLIDTSLKRLSSRRPEMTVYDLTEKGLYIFPENNESKYQANIRHSSMVAGHPVLCAGMIKIINGIPTKINNDSRHYEPKKANFDRLKFYFQQNKVDTHQTEMEFLSFERKCS